MGIKDKFFAFTKKFTQRKPIDYLKLLWAPFVATVFVLAADLITKSVIENTMALHQTIVVIPNFLEFYYTRNSGAAFSFFSGMTIFLIVFTSIALLALIIYLVYDADRLRLFTKLAFGFIIGGAAGNLYDRIAFGEVRDFIHLIYFGLDIPLLGSSFAGIFNIADLFLTVGAVMFFISIFIGTSVPSAEKADADKETAAQNGADTEADETADEADDKAQSGTESAEATNSVTQSGTENIGE